MNKLHTLFVPNLPFTPALRNGSALLPFISNCLGALVHVVLVPSCTRSQATPSTRAPALLESCPVCHLCPSLALALPSRSKLLSSLLVSPAPAASFSPFSSTLLGRRADVFASSYSSHHPLQYAVLNHTFYVPAPENIMEDFITFKSSHTLVIFSHFGTFKAVGPSSLWKFFL